MPDPHQHRLFEDDAPWDVDDQQQRLVATVVLPTGPRRTFDYLVSDALALELAVGCRVRVPFGRGNRPIVAYCVGVQTRADATSERKLKSIAQVVDRRSLISPAMLRTTAWMADNYLTGWGQVLQAVVPAAVREQSGTRQTTRFAPADGVAERIGELELPEKQARVVAVLAKSSVPLTAAELARRAGCTTAPVSALRKKGLLAAAAHRDWTIDMDQPEVARQSPLVLNRDQQVALEAITGALDSSEHRTILIHGVTGSGKTEVYIQAIDRVVRFGRQAIVLVPEISLTPQTTARFRARFDHVAVLHSHLTDAQRHRYWQRIADGRVQVVVGARSAIFAPTPHLGLVILDEEHESTFKQESAPRYHARDVARHRTRGEGVPLVLGSATPSLETWQESVSGKCQLVEMPRRILDRPLPRVGVIDLRDESLDRHSRGAISRRLHRAIDEALGEGGQVILLLNRRGFSTHIQCPACGVAVRCPHCDIALTHHRTDEQAVCHYCDFQQTPPRECPECHSPNIRYRGFGTQRLEAEVHSRFPNHRCLRMDTDSMQRRGSHEVALGAFRQGDVRILLGTQMIAKGLDFPNVTLVGVINADTALHLPDFRAAERTFHLVTQVAGRTGRGEKGGHVLVQTFEPDHPAIVAASAHDFRGFCDTELPLREEHGYPPFRDMVRLLVRGPVERIAREFTEHLALSMQDALDADQTRADLIGPAPAPITRLRGKYRFQIFLRCSKGHEMRLGVRRVMDQIQPPGGVEWIVDVDPLNML